MKMCSWARRAALLCLPLMSLVAPAGFAQTGYTIQSRNTPAADFVAAGDSVPISITAPSTAAVLRAAVLLNGRNVTSLLRPDGTPAALSGTVAGLEPGINKVELVATKNSRTPVAQLRVIRAMTPAVSCDALLTVGLANMIGAGISADSLMTSAQLNANGATSAAGVPLPEHCQVTGTLEPRTGVPNDRAYGTRFELRLPTRWNGRFFFQGQGGTGGSVVAATGQSQLPPGQTPPLASGWAVVSFDGGHQGGDVLFGLDDKAKTDFAYHSMDIAAVAAKSLISTYYAHGPNHSYFSGCSNGGRQGMMFSQRFPTYFDGIIAGSATYRLSVSYVDASWGLQQMTAIAPPNATGNPIMANAYSNADLTLLANDIRAVCDARDGVVDGMVLNTNACNYEDYDPARLQCVGAKTPDCLTEAQVVAMKNLQRGARNSQDQQLYNTWPWDPGVGGTQWRSWKLGTSQTAVPNAIKYSFCSTSVGYLYLTPPVPGFDCLTMNFDTDPARLAQNAWLDAQNPDLTAFRNEGGKILWYHGTVDPSTPYTEIVRYLDNLTAATTGSEAETSKFARLFVVPGFGHCNGGSGLDRFDPLTPMVTWVENGVAPTRMIASGNNFPGRTRPLCVYPQTAFYNGSGSIEDAANFSCR